MLQGLNDVLQKRTKDYVKLLDNFGTRYWLKWESVQAVYMFSSCLAVLHLAVDPQGKSEILGRICDWC